MSCGVPAPVVARLEPVLREGGLALVLQTRNNKRCVRLGRDRHPSSHVIISCHRIIMSSCHHVMSCMQSSEVLSSAKGGGGAERAVMAVGGRRGDGAANLQQVLGRADDLPVDGGHEGWYEVLPECGLGLDERVALGRARDGRGREVACGAAEPR